jgi:GT2 family glycosyltransferase
MDKAISVYCIWRDSEKQIYQTLKSLESLEALSGFNFAFFFYENDSIDNTAAILREWISNRRGAFLSEKINAEKFGSTPSNDRMKLLCSCRNKCKSLGELESDYSLVFDSDIDFNVQNFLTLVKDIESLPNAVMVTPNVRQNIPDLVFHTTEDSYYDVYPFRDRHGHDGMYFTDCPSFNKQDQFDWKIGKPIVCSSASGGFALIKSDAFANVSWSSDVKCDHVNMCYDLHKYGQIYCNPRNKVYVTIDLSQIDLDACSQIASQQKNTYEKYFYL